MATEQTRRPLVSVVIVNYKNTLDTMTCIESLHELDLDQGDVEVIVVDNASHDGSLDDIREAHPHVKLVALTMNTGFAGGCNRGVDVAHGEFVALLNNDARPDRAWLSTAIVALRADPGVGCIASKVLDWEGNTVDFVEAAASFYGHGFKLHVGEPDGPGFAHAHDVLFASGAAMVMPRSVYLDAGGFDEQYFMFFEDVDLGWRLWLLGFRVRYLPTSVVYHRHHATMSQYGSWRENFLLERNALYTVFKNYDDANLASILPAALALAVRRGVTLGGDADRLLDALDLSRDAPRLADDPPTAEVSKQVLASTYAIDDFVSNASYLAAARKAVQGHRRRTDQEILRLFHLPLHPNIADERFVSGFDATVAALGVADVFTARRKIVVATGDTLHAKMAGPAIRAFEIARALSSEHEVQLVTTNPCDLSYPGLVIRHVEPYEMVQLEAWCDVFIFQGFLMHQHPVLRFSNKVIVADIYDPFHLEQLEQARDLGEDARRLVVRDAVKVLNEQLERGDFFLCASPKQRDFWLGQLAAVGRINPVTYDMDENLTDLITVVPFGVPDDPPVKTRDAIKGVVRGIGKRDKVILWGGGIYNWFDPLVLLTAINKLRVRLPEVRVYFLGTRHPNPDVPEMRMAADAYALADELGLTGTHVFFNDDWVAYDDRVNYLLDADIGISTHLDHVETAFSFRTRILDYLWASLPVVCTEGDAFAELVEARGLGRTVPPGDPDALEAALYSLLSEPRALDACRRKIPPVAAEMRWSNGLAPLIEFCRAPHRAPDLLDAEMAAVILDRGAADARSRTGWRQDIRIIQALWREGGAQLVWQKAVGRLQRMPQTERVRRWSAK